MNSAVRSRTSLGHAEFAALFARESRKLWCLAASVLGRSTHADDVLQEAAIVGLSKLDEFDASTSFTAWMGRIVRYVAHNQRRKDARNARAIVEEPLEPETPWSDERDLHPTVVDVERIASDGRTFDDRLQRSLATLSDTARACLLLKTVLELEYKEIAAVLAIPEGTAMSHVHRAREALRKSLTAQEEGETP
jgi:RNA polymerase sigma-70 factor (ECF subfamily)